MGSLGELPPDELFSLVEISLIGNQAGNRVQGISPFSIW